MTADRPSLSLILPTLDEAENVSYLVPELLDVLAPSDEILVVDDGSTDGTRERVLAIAENDPRVRWIARRGARSLTASLLDGIGSARGTLVGWMDADGTMSPDDLCRLIDAVTSGADLAIGSRFTRGGRIKGQVGDRARDRWRALHRVRESRDAALPVLLSWALNVLLLPAILGDGAHDYTSGFVVGDRALIASLDLRGRHGEYFVHLWTQAKRRGARIVEVPYAAGTRDAGQSKTITRWADYLVRGRDYLGAAVSARFDRQRPPSPDRPGRLGGE
ncbi:glycosyltransferase [Sandaracinus amylolyticus]|uniref:Dolichol-phosphate mannosyltransferase n=1 Tax=Sandaracinus amylolyticus TaxID=927083 RepID=A0A0F6YF62_9BACT|nr:glycosyltransferase [Sandaracinus amylolyticus]AKF03220.1 Dolichol-phosphate mannosyltransferase [Sandaracinus amylolyticus]